MPINGITQTQPHGNKPRKLALTHFQHIVEYLPSRRDKAHFRIAIGKHGRRIFNPLLEDTSGLSDKALIEQHHQQVFVNELYQLSKGTNSLAPALPIYRIPGINYFVLNHFMENHRKWQNVSEENQHTAIKLWRESPITYQPKRTRSTTQMYALTISTLLSPVVLIPLIVLINISSVTTALWTFMLAQCLYLACCKLGPERFENPILQRLFHLNTHEQKNILKLSVLSGNTKVSDARALYHTVKTSGTSIANLEAEAHELAAAALITPAITNQDVLKLLSDTSFITHLPKKRVIELIKNIAQRYRTGDTGVSVDDAKNFFNLCFFFNDSFIDISQKYAITEAAKIQNKLKRAVLVHLILSSLIMALTVNSFSHPQNTGLPKSSEVILGVFSFSISFAIISLFTSCNISSTMQIAKKGNILNNLIDMLTDNGIKLPEETLKTQQNYLQEFSQINSSKAAYRNTLKEMLSHIVCCKKSRSTPAEAVPLLRATRGATAPRLESLDREIPRPMAGAYAGSVGP